MIGGLHELEHILRKIRIVDDMKITLTVFLYIAPHDHGRCRFHGMELNICQRVNQPAVRCHTVTHIGSDILKILHILGIAAQSGLLVFQLRKGKTGHPVNLIHGVCVPAGPRSKIFFHQT